MDIPSPDFVERVKEAFLLDRDNPDRQRDLQTLVEMALHRKDFSLAGRLAAIGFLAPRSADQEPALGQLYGLAVCVQEALAVLHPPDDRWRVFSWLAEAQAAGADSNLTGQAVLHILQEAGRLGEEAADVPFLRQLADLAKRLPEGQALAADLRQKADNLEEQERDRLCQEANALWERARKLAAVDSLEDPVAADALAGQWPTLRVLALTGEEAAGRWRKILGLAGRAYELARRGQHPQLNELERFRQQATQKSALAEEAAREHAGRLDREKQQRRETMRRLGDEVEKKLQRRQELLQAQRDWIEAVGRPPAAGPSDVTLASGKSPLSAPAASPPAVEGELAELNAALAASLRQLISQCYDYLAQVDAEDKEIQELRAWATGILPHTGRENLAKLQQETAASLAQLEEGLKEAQGFYDKGEADRAAGRLDALSPEFKGGPEWAALDKQTRQARLWQQWQSIQAAALSQHDYNGSTLVAMRRFLAFRLPAVYWEKSAAGRYLDEALKKARADAHRQMGGYQSPYFLGPLKRWLELAWTIQLARPAAPDKGGGAQPIPQGEWRAESFLRQVAEACAFKRQNELGQLVERGPLPAGASNPATTETVLQAALTSLTPDAWEKAYSQVKVPIPPGGGVVEKGLLDRLLDYLPPVLRQSPLLAAITGFALILLCGGLFLGTAYYGGSRLGILGVPTEDPVIVAQMLALTPRVTRVTATHPPQTPTPFATPTPIDTPTPSDTPTPTPKPPEQSDFLLVDTAALSPTLPMLAEAAWLINPDQATAEPPFSDATLWTAGTLDAGAPFYYTTLAADRTAGVTWAMDSFFNEGLYQLYVQDTPFFSNGPQAYSVSLDGQPVAPYVGTASIIFDDDTRGQVANEWLPLGAYQVAANQRLTVHTDLVANGLSFAATPLLVVKVPPEQKALLDGFAGGRTLVSLLDDGRASFYRQRGDRSWEPIPPDQYEIVFGLKPYSSILAWGGSFLSRTFDPLRDYGARVEWAPVGRLPAGEYELYVLVPPEHATSETEWDLLADGVEVGREADAPLAQADSAGQWVSLGLWTLTEEAAVTVRLTVAKDLGHTVAADIGVDAVALLQVGR